MKLGIDIDGVVVDFVTPFLPLLQEAMGHPVRYDDITAYRFQHALGYSDEVEDWVRGEIDRRDLLRGLPRIPGSLESIRRFHREHEIHFVTARPEAKWEDVTREWLRVQGFPYSSVLFREGRKAEGSEGFDLFVEDYLENALDLVAQGIHVCLFDQPWNQNSDLPRRCTRVHSWQEVEDVVASLRC